MIKMRINGKVVNAKENELALVVAKREGFEIPNLCYHPALKPDGACRLCLVEVKSKREGKPNKITTSCTLEVTEGMEILLDSPDVMENRRNVLEMLRARVPDSPYLYELGKQHGLEFVDIKEQDEKCILCGLCARVCTELVGAKALNFEGRGVDTYFRPPFGETPDSCVACTSCAFVCPVNCIPVEKTDEHIKIWGKEFPRLKCVSCGEPLELVQEHLDLIKTRVESIVEDEFLTCEKCSRLKTVEVMRKVTDGQLELKPGRSK
jgi:NADH dehydrogenase/NADH:ubiquinone oxidoreductase subunit G